MKRKVMLLGMVLVAAEAADVHAQVLRGSDIMNKLTDDIVAQCPGATGIDYQGGGSTSGENLIANGTQQVAPMTRFLQPVASTTCTFPDTSTSEAIRVGTRKVEVLTSAVHKDACDPSAETACDVTGGLRSANAPLFPACPALGGDWKHALRLLYFGLNCEDGLNPQGIVGVRNCLDPARLALVSSWGNLFENPSSECAAGGGGGALPAGSCTELRHAFRRDERSDSADAFRDLLGANIGRTGTTGYPFCNEYPAQDAQAPVTGGACANNTHCPLNTTCVANVCTAVTAPASCGDSALQSTEECDDGNTANFDGCSAVCLKEPGATPACSGELTGDLPAGAPGLPTLLFTDASQDADPIRRACSGTFNVALGTSTVDTKMAEEVCHRDGTLGLVLPISVPAALDGVPTSQLLANVYPTIACRHGRFINGSAPVIKPGIGAARRFCLCPDGRTPRNTWWDASERLARPGACTAGVCTSDSQCGVAGGTCVGGVCTSGNCGGNGQCGTSGGVCAASAAATCPVPATDANDARCINAKNNKPSIAASSFPSAGCVVPSASIDGRAFNLTLRTQTGGLQKTAYNGNREIVGAFYRLHATRTLLGNGGADLVGTNGLCDDGACCAALDSGQQIGCLTSASSCSIGFAPSQAFTAIDPSATPAAGNDTVAHAQSLALRSGFLPLECSYPLLGGALYLSTMMGFENTSGTERALAQCYSGVGLMGGHTVTSLLLAAGFTPFDSGPRCQDFTEEVTCGDTPADACANNTAGFACQDDDDCAAGLTCVVTPEPGGRTKGNCQ